MTKHLVNYKIFRIFATNPPIQIKPCFRDGCGIIDLIYLIIMKDILINYGYAPDGTPIDYIDGKGIHWIYQGNGKNSGDSWYGIPKDTN